MRVERRLTLEGLAEIRERVAHQLDPVFCPETKYREMRKDRENLLFHASAVEAELTESLATLATLMDAASETGAERDRYKTALLNPVTAVGFLMDQVEQPVDDEDGEP